MNEGGHLQPIKRRPGQMEEVRGTSGLLRHWRRTTRATWEGQKVAPADLRPASIHRPGSACCSASGNTRPSLPFRSTNLEHIYAITNLTANVRGPDSGPSIRSWSIGQAVQRNCAVPFLLEPTAIVFSIHGQECRKLTPTTAGRPG